MRLLITTQAVDLDDPVLGFFHRWLEEFSTTCESIHVICLKEGRHDLPKNVTVHSLGKEAGCSRATYLLRFFKYVFLLRNAYDSVFVHMNAEYVVLGGVLWRLWHKRIVLWRNHKMPGVITWLASHISHAVCYTSSSAYVARFKNTVQMPIGIDTDFFAPGAQRTRRSLLFLGRFDRVKLCAEFVEALQHVHEAGIPFVADVVGDPTDPASTYARMVREHAASLVTAGVLTLHAGVPNAQARDFFRSHEFYVNLTPSGSFDKTIGEAMAAGCVVICANDAVRGIIPPELFVNDPTSVETVQQAIHHALGMGEESMRALTARSRAWIKNEHSLAYLVSKLLPVLQHIR